MRITKPKSLPNPLTLMLLVIIVAAIGTWLLPAGQYSKLSPGNNKAFVITSTSGAVSLPFTQHILDSLSIKVVLQKFINGDIRKPISVPNTISNCSEGHKALLLSSRRL